MLKPCTAGPDERGNDRLDPSQTRSLREEET